jgi:hypothetical protein
MPCQQNNHMASADKVSTDKRRHTAVSVADATGSGTAKKAKREAEKKASAERQMDDWIAHFRTGVTRAQLDNFIELWRRVQTIADAMIEAQVESDQRGMAQGGLNEMNRIVIRLAGDKTTAGPADTKTADDTDDVGNHASKASGGGTESTVAVAAAAAGKGAHGEKDDGGDDDIGKKKPGPVTVIATCVSVLMSDALMSLMVGSVWLFGL